MWPATVDDGVMRIPSLGRRGEGWVVLQMAALAGIGIVGFIGPPWPTSMRHALWIAGVVLVTTGALLGLLGIRALGASLTALPHPAAGAELRREGVYAHARHPIYGALLLVGGGWFVLTSVWAAVPWLCLLAILLAKSHREEAWLLERYDGYASYRAEVRRRFVPYVC
jgi:protein-S-isoprenylcysteine O-methyltransferase Ste14